LDVGQCGPGAAHEDRVLSMRRSFAGYADREFAAKNVENRPIDMAAIDASYAPGAEPLAMQLRAV
jgi:hypothetical protein